MHMCLLYVFLSACVPVVCASSFFVVYLFVMVHLYDYQSLKKGFSILQMNQNM